MSNEWEDKRQKLNELFKELQQKPDSEKMGYSLSPGGILNAYREADISFEEAKDALQRQPITLSIQRFNALQALVGAFEVADAAEVTSANLRVYPLGEISWAGSEVVIRLDLDAPAGVIKHAKS